MSDLHQNGVANPETPASDRRTEMANDDAQNSQPKVYPSQGVRQPGGRRQRCP